jgi:hypothetical protein
VEQARSQIATNHHPKQEQTLAFAVVVTMRSCSIKLAAMFRIIAER